MATRPFLVLAAGAAMLLPSVSPGQAQTEAHPIVGVWTLNRDRSNYESDVGPRTQMRRFGVDDEGYLVSIRITHTRGGNPTFALTRAKFDGSDYPVWTSGRVYQQVSTGDGSAGTAAWEVVDERTLRLTQKNSAGEVGPLSVSTWEISGDGNTLTVTTSGTNQDGERVHTVSVYDRLQD